MLGIFDSGVGGLSVLKVLKEKTPHVNVVYFGDIKNAPYGIKSQEDLKKLTLAGVKILLENGATNILSACNSISTFMIKEDLKNLSTKEFEVVEMIKPTVKEFSKNKENEIMIFATPATIKSQTYQNNFEKEGIKIKTFSIPDLAGAIEFGAKKEEINKIVKKAVLKSLKKDFKTALLCCTHYPFVKNEFEDTFAKSGKKIDVYDPAEAVAKETISKFGLFKPNQSKKGKIKFLISKESPNFRKLVAENFNNQEYSIRVI